MREWGEVPIMRQEEMDAEFWLLLRDVKRKLPRLAHSDQVEVVNRLFYPAQKSRRGTFYRHWRKAVKRANQRLGLFGR